MEHYYFNFGHLDTLQHTCQNTNGKMISQLGQRFKYQYCTIVFVPCKKLKTKFGH